MYDRLRLEVWLLVGLIGVAAVPLMAWSRTRAPGLEYPLVGLIGAMDFAVVTAVMSLTGGVTGPFWPISVGPGRGCHDPGVRCVPAVCSGIEAVSRRGVRAEQPGSRASRIDLAVQGGLAGSKPKGATTKGVTPAILALIWQSGSATAPKR